MNIGYVRKSQQLKQRAVKTASNTIPTALKDLIKSNASLNCTGVPISVLARVGTCHMHGSQCSPSHDKYSAANQKVSTMLEPDKDDREGDYWLAPRNLSSGDEEGGRAGS